MKVFIEVVEKSKGQVGAIPLSGVEFVHAFEGDKCLVYYTRKGTVIQEGVVDMSYEAFLSKFGAEGKKKKNGS